MVYDSYQKPSGSFFSSYEGPYDIQASEAKFYYSVRVQYKYVNALTIRYTYCSPLV